MKALFSQFSKIWHACNPVQRIAALGIILLATLILLLLPFKAAFSTSYVPLFKTPLSSQDLKAVVAHLDHFSIPYKELKDKGILVEEEHVEKIRLELMEANILKQGQVKGFELFDTNTWIKGEKELQVLEMRALKGQLEKDLMGFEQIKQASVILDIPPQRSFSQTPYKTKASCILTLMPGARLTSSQLNAITNHLAGAVRGLEPNMIAISDTTGKLYKAIDPEAKDALFPYNDFLALDEMKEQIKQYLDTVFGKGKYISSIHASANQKEKCTVTIIVAAADTWLKEQEGEKTTFQTQIGAHLALLASGMNCEADVHVDFMPFEKKTHIREKSEEGRSYKGILFVLASALTVLFLPLFLMKKKQRKKQVNRDDGNHLFLTKIDIERLVLSMKEENPKTLATMISYLEPLKAERLIASFPVKMQEEILNELEKEEI